MRKTARNGTALHAALGVAVALACLVGLCPAHAQEWPAKDITLIVKTTPGGGLDVVARATAPFIEKHLPRKVNVIVKNVPGASQKVGLMETLRSKPDGYTVDIIDPLDVTVLQTGGQLKGVDTMKINWLGTVDNLTYLLKPLLFPTTRR